MVPSVLSRNWCCAVKNFGEFPYLRRLATPPSYFQPYSPCPSLEFCFTQGLGNHRYKTGTWTVKGWPICKDESNELVWFTQICVHLALELLQAPMTCCLSKHISRSSNLIIFIYQWSELVCRWCPIPKTMLSNTLSGTCWNHLWSLASGVKLLHMTVLPIYIPIHAFYPLTLHTSDGLVYGICQGKQAQLWAKHMKTNRILKFLGRRQTKGHYVAIQFFVKILLCTAVQTLDSPSLSRCLLTRPIWV